MAFTRDSMHGKRGRHVPSRGPAVFADNGYCGYSFNNGLIRFHDSTTAPIFRQYCFEMFPQLMSLDPQADVLAFDWNGRQYLTAQVDGKPDVMILRADLAADNLEQLVTVDHFAEVLENDDVSAFFDGDLYDQWRVSIGRPNKYVGFKDCIEYQVPFWLGGASDVSNLQRSNMDVCWGIGVQMREQTRDLPPGATVQFTMG